MRGLTVIVAAADPERFRAALTLATAQAALGGRARVYCHEGAVALLARDREDEPAPSGLPGRAELLAMAREGGVGLIACQTGLAAAAIDFAALVEGVEPGGMVAVLAALGDDRMVIA